MFRTPANVKITESPGMLYVKVNASAIAEALLHYIDLGEKYLPFDDDTVDEVVFSTHRTRDEYLLILHLKPKENSDGGHNSDSS